MSDSLMVGRKTWDLCCCWKQLWVLAGAYSGYYAKHHDNQQKDCQQSES